jgi:2-keto-4-pentenoate hydratase/2-oxohepta-3-ene-1,7-dioic acid hydratase in catechol pathway
MAIDGIGIGTPVVGTDELPVLVRDGSLYSLGLPSIVDAIASGSLTLAGVDSAPLPDARLVAPVRPGKVVAIGLNYLDHIRETGMERPKHPLVFAKFPSSVIGPDEPIEIDRRLTSRVDWEVELAVVVGHTMRRVPVEEALDYVFGYTVGNDISARDLQFGDGQWTRGKSLDTFCPLGPAIVPAEEVLDPQALRLRTRVNGETVQDSSTSEMIFGVAELLAFCSDAFTLEPGDVVMTGTPWGCGEFMDPKRGLVDGDVVEAEVEGIGVLRNPVVEMAATPLARPQVPAT